MTISRITRENILEFVLNRKSKFCRRLELLEFLEKIWNLKEMSSSDHRFKNAREDIWQHMINNEDWDDGYLLKNRLNLLDCDDKTFILFIENYLHPNVIMNTSDLKEIKFRMNSFLRNDGYVLKEESKISGIPVFKVLEVGEQIVNKYDVALSFAGEQREYVEKVANSLKEKGVKVFYDKYEEKDMWGENLLEYLAKIFGKRIRYFCVVFISKEYVDKKWTKYEFRHALSKEIKEDRLFILPARFDDTELEGLIPTKCYINLRDRTPEGFAEMIFQKLIEFDF